MRPCKGDKAAVQTLIQQKADVNAAASRRSDRDSVGRLPQRPGHGGSADRRRRGREEAQSRWRDAAVAWPAINGSAPMIQKLLKAGADANETASQRRDCR